MKTVIISAFPGVGKTYFSENTKLKVKDSDSSKFDKKNFPQNYVDSIKKDMGKYDIILVSSHEEVRSLLYESKIEYNLVFPNGDCKNEYIQRYKDRGSPEAFIKLLDEMWEQWIESCIYDGGDSTWFRSGVAIKLDCGRYLSDVVDQIL